MRRALVAPYVDMFVELASPRGEIGLSIIPDSDTLRLLVSVKICWLAWCLLY